MSDKWIPNPDPFPSRPPTDWPAARPSAPVDELPAETESEGSTTNTRMILGMIGIALLVVAVGYLVFRTLRPAAKQAAPPSTSASPSTASNPSTTTTLPSGPSITQAQLDQLTGSLVPFIEKTRQLTFTTPPRPVLDDDATFDKAAARQIARDDALMKRLATPFQVLGMNPQGVDLGDALRSFYGTRSVVFYDPLLHAVHVKATPATPYLSVVLVVGLTEQLDDQHFGVGAIDHPTQFGDSVIGLRTLVEGDAWRVASIWISTQPARDQDQARRELAARRGADADTSKVPAALSGWLRLPIDVGVNFTTNLVTSTSSSPLDAAFKNPPDGSAQVDAPGRFTAPVPQLAVTAPPVDGTVTTSGTFGQYFLQAMLSPVVDDQTLPIAMDGYRGDTMVVYSGGSGSCVRMDITTGDSSVDNLRSALATWVAKRTGKVRLVPDPKRPGRQLIRFDACTPGSGQSGDTTTTMPARGPNSSSTVPGRPEA